MLKDWLKRLGGQGSGSLPVDPSDQLVELPFPASRGGSVVSQARRHLQRDLYETCQRQLEIIRHSLQLRTAALLWSGPDPDKLSLYAISSAVAIPQMPPCPLGFGVTGALLREHHELMIAPVRPHSPALPYYRSMQEVGSLLALRLDLGKEEGFEEAGLGILCLDRTQDAPFTERELHLARLLVLQLTASIQQVRQQLAGDRERHVYRLAFDGLRQLNAALGLTSVFAASAQAIRSIVAADFVAICLAEEEFHRVAYAEGELAEKLCGLSFGRDEGLVGQALKYNFTLPENGDYLGQSPVFSRDHLFSGYRSLLIVPLRREEGPLSGALVVAARKAGAFSRSCREILELLATQVAIKLDLAEAHEQLNRMATIDSLTGIANRRAYQRGFEAMLERAKRRPGTLYLILCDIDHFKKINDNYGHPFGDEVLRQVARLFDGVVRSVDLAARTGGEEFAILLEDADDDGAWKVAERLRGMVQQLKLSHQGRPVPVTISLGISGYPQDASSLEKLVSCADQALYQAKHNGRDRTVLWCDMADLQPQSR